MQLPIDQMAFVIFKSYFVTFSFLLQSLQNLHPYNWKQSGNHADVFECFDVWSFLFTSDHSSSTYYQSLLYQRQSDLNLIPNKVYAIDVNWRKTCIEIIKHELPYPVFDSDTLEVSFSIPFHLNTHTCFIYVPK